MSFFSTEGILKYPFAFGLGFLCTYLLTPVIRKLAPALHMTDMPGGRHIHKTPTPRAGGIAVFLGLHVACAGIFFMPWSAPLAGQLSPVWWWHFLILSTLVLGLGLVDDARNIGPYTKLAGQVIVAVLAFFMDMRVGGILGFSLPWILDFIATVAWFLLIINAFNLIDGIDGLATGLGGIAAIGIAGSFAFRHLPSDVLILTGFVGACAAFLRYNFHPASIFLGDSGSMFIGFFLAAVALSPGSKGTGLTAIFVPLLAFGIPVLDTALAVWRRSVARVAHIPGSHGVFEGDTRHVHHRMLTAGLSYRATTALLYAGAIAMVTVGLLTMLYKSRATGIYILAFMAGAYVIVRHVARTELWMSAEAIAMGLARPPTRVIAVILYPLIDVVILAITFLIACVLTAPGLSGGEFKLYWFNQVPLSVGIPFLALVLTNTYSRVWSRARLSEYVLLGLSVASGALLAASITDIVEASTLSIVIRQAGIYCSLSIPMLILLRVFPRGVQDAMVFARHTSKPQHAAGRTLIYGGGNQCILFLKKQTTAPDHGHSHRIVGILDEDRNLWGRYVYGFRVLGGMKSLPEAVKQHNATEIIVTVRLCPDRRAVLDRIADEHGIAILWWRTSLDDQRPS